MAILIAASHLKHHWANNITINVKHQWIELEDITIFFTKPVG